ncbi:hypothetical protein [Mycolicibacterium brisbanense]|nr:hypothetical protein [Mycolicibacterium brisbanense]MCV7157291.1 hypothetical protein [Mycolicibacterium brisbanense]
MQTEDIALDDTLRAVAALADRDTVALLKKLLCWPYHLGNHRRPRLGSE